MNEVFRIAQKEIGTTEKPLNSNKTKYGKWFGLDSLAWCGIFVSWCYAQAGFQLPKIGFSKGYAGCQTAVAYFKKNGMITNNPVQGDIVFFDWNADGRFDHTGLFVKWLNDTEFETIEGNTAIGNDSNGGQVMTRKRSKKNVLFVHVK
jgi:hypothetical protein